MSSKFAILQSDGSGLRGVESPVHVWLGPNVIRYVGEFGAYWCVSDVDTSSLLVLDAAGTIRMQRACPPVDRILRGDTKLVGLRWAEAWHATGSLGSEATALDLDTGEPIWRGQLMQLLGGTRGLARVDGSPRAIDLATGEEARALVEERVTPSQLVSPGTTLSLEGGVAMFEESRRALRWGPWEEALQAMHFDVPWAECLAVPGGLVLTRPSPILRWPIHYADESRAVPVVCAREREEATVLSTLGRILILEHPVQGRLALYGVSTNGLARGATVGVSDFVTLSNGETSALTLVHRNSLGQIVKQHSTPPGRRASTRRSPPPKPASALHSQVWAVWDALVTAGYLDELPRDQVEPRLRRLFRDGTLPRWGAAVMLQSVYGETGGLDRGFLSHDWRFGQETDDVVAELDRCVRTGPLRFKQLKKDDEGILLQWESATTGEVDNDWVFVEEGLLDVVSVVNRVLRQAGSELSFYSLDTSGDWIAVVACTQAVVKQLSTVTSLLWV
ncbi:MAG: hypothetical protein AAGE52_15770 [Myxococcota bacterium]